jgi:hypothetical protein
MFDNDYPDPMFVYELFSPGMCKYIEQYCRRQGKVYYEDEDGNLHPINFVKASNDDIILTRTSK